MRTSDRARAVRGHDRRDVYLPAGKTWVSLRGGEYAADRPSGWTRHRRGARVLREGLHDRGAFVGGIESEVQADIGRCAKGFPPSGRWNGGRALISVVAPKTPAAHLPVSQPGRPDKRQGGARPLLGGPADHRKNNIERLERTFLGGEALPVIFQNYGPAGTAITLARSQVRQRHHLV